MKLIIAVAFLFVVSVSHSKNDNESKYRVCYYTNWAQYRPGDGKYFPEDVDTSLCTHIIYSFTSMEGNKLKPYEWNDESTDWAKGMYERFNDLKLKNPDIKTLLAVGGWTFGTTLMTAMLATQANRREFIDDVIAKCREYNFDGFDLDFEYPGSRGSPAEDKYLYTRLVEEMRSAFIQEGIDTFRPRLLLSAAVAAGKETIDAGYEVDRICAELDFVNLMSYDLNGAWDNITGLNSALYSHPAEDAHYRIRNIDWAANYWVSLGCPKDKLVVGVATYGRSFNLVSESNNGLRAPSNGAAVAGQYTREAGFYSYYELCQAVLNDPTVSYTFDEDHQTPYASKGSYWAGFDDTKSLEVKARYISDNDFAGFMIWALDLDDFNGKFCGGQPYPLLKALNQAFLDRVPTESPTTAVPGSTTEVYTGTTPTLPPGISSTASTEATSTTTLEVPTNSQDICDGQNNGFAPNPQDCYTFYQCNNGISYLQGCTAGTMYNPPIKVCDWPHAVNQDYRGCCENEGLYCADIIP